MVLHRKEFWKAFGRVFLVSLISVIVGGGLIFLYSDLVEMITRLSFFSFILFIYSLIEACIVFKKRAAIKEDDLTRQGDYLFAGLRFLVILIPPAVVVACIAMMCLMASWANSGYHG